jgi:hypothetical protein
MPGHDDEAPAFDTSVAHVARVYDYWLGGRFPQTHTLPGRPSPV